MTDREFRRGGLSPAQRLQALRGLHETQELPPSFSAAVLDVHKRGKVMRKVGRNGIGVQYQGVDYFWWSEESAVCAAMVGEEVMVKFDPQASNVCYVLNAAGAVIEVLSKKGEADWFDAESTAREIAKNRRAIARTTEQLAHVQAPQIRAEAKRTLSNREKLQFVNTFPVPEAPARRQPGHNQPIPEANRRAKGRGYHFASADQAAEIAANVGRRQERRSADRARVAATRETLDDIEPVAASAAPADTYEDQAGLDEI